MKSKCGKIDCLLINLTINSALSTLYPYEEKGFFPYMQCQLAFFLLLVK